LWALLTHVDRAIVQYQPWTLAKKEDAESHQRLDEILYSAAETLRIAAILLKPVLPEISEKIWSQLGMTTKLIDQRIDQLTWGGLVAGQALGEAAQLFPRLDVKQTVEKMFEMEQIEVARQNALLGKTTPAAEPAVVWTRPEGVPPLAETITIDDFTKVDLRVARILAAEAVKGADKLLKLTVDVAEEQPRTIVAGIAKAYAPETLVGRKVVIVANLAPRKLRGIESNGMIVAASLVDGAPVLAAFLEEVPVGARLK
jgi:methionyl-tRNA synthetase